jgi:hypothetical protein
MLRNDCPAGFQSALYQRPHCNVFISDGTATFNTPEVSADQIQSIMLATLKTAFAQVENTTAMIHELGEQRIAFAG